MVFYIADTHFGHANIIRSCGRPFSDVDEMNEALIAAWNARVGPDDYIFILGDMFFRCADVEPLLRRLRGRKHLILGNHDDTWIRKVDMGRYFRTVSEMMEMSDGQRSAILCHYPLLTWKEPSRNYMIHGHIHNNTDADFWPLLCARDRALNAGVDINGFRPVTFDELLENNRWWKLAHGGPA